VPFQFTRLSIGDPLLGGTSGSILFVDSNLTIAQDNSNLFWDNPNNILKVKEEAWITSVGAGTTPVENIFKFIPANDASGTYSFFQCINSDDANEKSFVIRNQNASASATTFLNLGSSGDQIYLGTTSNPTLLYLTNAAGLDINGNIAGDTIAGTTITGANVTSGLNPGHTHDETSIGIGSGITGSVVFLDGSQQFAQDNDNFFWDDTNNRLGIGTATPATDLEVVGATKSSTLLITGLSEFEDNVQITGGKKVIYDS